MISEIRGQGFVVQWVQVRLAYKHSQAICRDIVGYVCILFNQGRSQGAGGGGSLGSKEPPKQRKVHQKGPLAVCKGPLECTKKIRFG